MLGRDHEITSGAICASTILLFNFPVAPQPHLAIVPITVGCTFIGALLPDIDHKNSMISKKFKIPLYKLFKHRGVTHSLFMWAALTILIGGLFQLIFKYPTFVAMRQSWAYGVISGISFGYLLHLIEDSLSQAGIRWFAPFSGYDQYSYQHYGTLLRKPVRWKKGRHKKIPLRHWWGRGYVVGGTAELVLVGMSIGLLIFAIADYVYFKSGLLNMMR